MKEILGAEKDGYVTWRCLEGTVLACVVFNSPVCGKFRPYANIERIRQFCAENQDSLVPAAVAGRDVDWACKHSEGYIRSGDMRVDKQGYPVEPWKFIYPED